MWVCTGILSHYAESRSLFTCKSKPRFAVIDFLTVEMIFICTLAHYSSLGIECAVLIMWFKVLKIQTTRKIGAVFRRKTTIYIRSTLEIYFAGFEWVKKRKKCAKIRNESEMNLKWIAKLIYIVLQRSTLLSLWLTSDLGIVKTPLTDAICHNSKVIMVHYLWILSNVSPVYALLDEHRFITSRGTLANKQNYCKASSGLRERRNIHSLLTFSVAFPQIY